MLDWLVGALCSIPSVCFAKKHVKGAETCRWGRDSKDCWLWGQKTGCPLPARNLSMSVYSSKTPAGHAQLLGDPVNF